MLRRTKIVVTLGPATDDEDILRQLIAEGIDVVRLNFSHGTQQQQKKRAKQVRALAQESGRCIAVLGDLQGPKIRIAGFRQGSVTLEEQQPFALDTDLAPDQGDQHQVGTDYRHLARDCRPGDSLLLDDGRIMLEVVDIQGSRIHCTVQTGGVLSDCKGINRQGGGLSASALSEKDRQDIRLAAEIKVDYLAVSFPRSRADIDQARELLSAAGGRAGIVAKIERAEAVADDEVLNRMIEASDALMIARGDLGVEIGDANLVGLQKDIILRTRRLNKPIITATQMMESMIHSQLPTRAEVFDVANAVLDGTDAVMLSGETAIGEFPVETVRHMVRIIRGAESRPQMQISSHRIDRDFVRIDETIAMSAMYAANHLHDIKAIICLTETGYTPLLMSRISSSIPIFALCCQPQTQHKVALYRGVSAIPFNAADWPAEQVNRQSIETLKQRHIIEDGDLVLLTKGDYINVQGGTNTMRVVRVGDTVF